MKKNIFLFFFVCVTMINNSAHADEKSFDAIIAVERLLQMDDVVLHRLNNGVDICYVANIEVELVIRDYASTYYHGNSRSQIALAIDDIMHTLIAVIRLEDGDSAMSLVEINNMKRISTTNNAIFFLFCLYSEYEEVPRK